MVLTYSLKYLAMYMVQEIFIIKGRVYKKDNLNKVYGIGNLYLHNEPGL